MPRDSDILIVGGGLVGASLACALGRSGLRIALVEAQPFAVDRQPNYDDRSIALAQGSQRIFAGMGLWDALADKVSPIHTIHVSDRGHFGFTRLQREEEGVPALGFVVSARVLGNALIERLDQLPDVVRLAPARLLDFHADAAAMEARLEVDGQPQVHRSALMVAADGVNSSVRTQLEINTEQRDYGQTAIIANVTPERPHRNVAYERFTDTGPMALLPLRDNHCALVWTVLSDQADEIMVLDEAAFLARLQERFGYRVGRFVKAGTRHAYPLQLVRAEQSVATRLALIGNAVHTLHPIAGQGFNLGLRDVAALADVVIDAQRAGDDIGHSHMLKRYADWRETDHGRVVWFTDGMVRLFSNSYPPLAWARNTGMLALDLCPPVKRLFGRLTMGRAGRLPRLARGLEL
ncbi:MAG: 2-octaprenyl-6-methoxyphenyl hydroxylase [Thiogranum sp.]|nr:2-octaprenyl-6-methoxyphenyl hydroxylase [Thiogranum sp.]